MKKFMGIVLAVLFVAGVVTPSFAAKASDKKEYDRIVAQVVSLDVATKTMVVTEEKTGASRTIKISAKAASQLKVGDRVRIKLKAGTSESAGVRVLKAPAPVEPAAEPAAEGASAPVKK